MHEKLNQIIERHCRALAHQLKGGIGTAGFHKGRQAAAALDDHLKTLLQAPEAAIMAGMETAMAPSDELSRIVNQAIPADSRLYSIRAESQGNRTT